MKRLFAVILIFASFSLAGYAEATDLRNAVERGDVAVVKALLEKDGDVQADFISKDATETGQRALGRFNVRATAAVRYEDGKYKMVELSGSAADR